jgi:hypothetical protein
VGDRAAERAGLRPLDVDVDPLVVAGGVGEQVHLLLGDLDVLAVAEVLADEAFSSSMPLIMRGAMRASMAPRRGPARTRDPDRAMVRACGGRRYESGTWVPTLLTDLLHAQPPSPTSRPSSTTVPATGPAHLRRARGAVEPPRARAARLGVRSRAPRSCGAARTRPASSRDGERGRKVGATAVPLNYRLSDEEAAYVTDHSDASIVYVDAEFAPLFSASAPIPKVQHVLVFDGAAPTGMRRARPAARWRRRAAPAPPDDPTEPGATMIYTSGTTGKPKGALRRRRRRARSRSAACSQFIGYRPDDVYLTTGPLYHSGPGGFMGIALALGQTVVVQRKFDPEDWLRLLETYRCTSTFAAPTPDPHDLQPARRGEGALRPVLDADHDRQRGAVELRPQAGSTWDFPPSRCSRCTAPPSWA